MILHTYCIAWMLAAIPKIRNVQMFGSDTNYHRCRSCVCKEYANSRLSTIKNTPHCPLNTLTQVVDQVNYIITWYHVTQVNSNGWLIFPISNWPATKKRCRILNLGWKSGFVVVNQGTFYKIGISGGFYFPNCESGNRA